jgi:enterobactin synthetase component D
VVIDVSSFEISAPGFGPALDVHCVVFDFQNLVGDDYFRHKVPMANAARHATRKRQAEFLAGRIAAREALAAQGLPGCIPGTGEKREPLWPAGWTGSITHSHNVAMAVALPSSPNLPNGVGLDIESVLDLQLLLEIKRSIMDEREADLLLYSKTLSFAEGGTLLFSAKESLFKALFYQVGDWFDFDAARLTSVNTEEQVFRLQLTRSLAPHLFAGRQFCGTYRTFDDKLLTLIVWDSVDLKVCANDRDLARLLGWHGEWKFNL